MFHVVLQKAVPKRSRAQDRRNNEATLAITHPASTDYLEGCPALHQTDQG